MGAPQTTFKRVEKKYPLTTEQYMRLWARLQDHFVPDAYPSATIISIYYDTPDYELIRTSLQKPTYKEKIRLRSYCTPTETDTVFLELKKKVQGTVYKRRVALTLAQARAYLAGGAAPEPDNQIWHEIDWFRHRYPLKAKSALCCERTAWVSKENPALRLTFDMNIRHRENDLDLAFGAGGEVLCPGLVLMELKIPDALPVWMAHIFSEEGVFPTTFSKYGTCYGQQLGPQFMRELYAATASAATASHPHSPVTLHRLEGTA